MGRAGAAAAEMAILLPFVALMFVAAVDFCRVFYVTQTIESCAHVAALYASGTHTWHNTAYGDEPPDAGLVDAIVRELGALLTPGRPAPEFADLVAAARRGAVAEGRSLDPPLRGEDVTVAYSSGRASVTVRYRFTMFTPLLGGRRSIARTVHMQVMPQPAGSPSPLASLL